VSETPEEVKRLLESIEAFESIEDPAERTSAVSEALRKWPDYHAKLRQIREVSVQALRNEQRKTWPEIASIIGEVTPERAQQISKGLSGAQRKKNKAEAEKAKPTE
jgi:hypothetical protein